jgi:acyl-CoA reductase-like NAD-dependent aldehyde dehydrogenase
MEKLVKRISLMKIGDPLEKETNIGPLAREDLFTKLKY